MEQKIMIPRDMRYENEVIPKITNNMKAECMGEFSWKEDAPYYDDNGNYIEHEAERVVPWDLCKKIYKRMAQIASTDNDD